VTNAQNMFSVHCQLRRIYTSGFNICHKKKASLLDFSLSFPEHI